jgi:hypothetical protein
MNPRDDPDAAYAAFMSMPSAEWIGLIGSFMRGGTLTPAENEGFNRALRDRVRDTAEPDEVMSRAGNDEPEDDCG